MPTGDFACGGSGDQQRRSPRPANTMAIVALAIRCAPPGAGNARLSFRSPASRSIASTQPTPNSAGPMTANTEKPENR